MHHRPTRHSSTTPCPHTPDTHLWVFLEVRDGVPEPKHVHVSDDDVHPEFEEDLRRRKEGRECQELQGSVRGYKGVAGVAGRR